MIGLVSSLYLWKDLITCQCFISIHCLRNFLDSWKQVYWSTLIFSQANVNISLISRPAKWGTRIFFRWLFWIYYEDETSKLNPLFPWNNPNYVFSVGLLNRREINIALKLQNFMHFFLAPGFNWDFLNP